VSAFLMFVEKKIYIFSSTISLLPMNQIAEYLFGMAQMYKHILQTSKKTFSFP